MKLGLGHHTRLVVHADIDHSLVRWESFNRGADREGLQETREVLDRFEPDMAFGLSTARSPAETARLAELLKGYPLAFVAVNGGEQLHLNDQQLPAEEFLSGLAHRAPDQTWEGRVQSSGWDSALVNTMVEDLMRAEGLKPAPGFGPPFENLRNYSRADGLKVSVQQGQAGLHVSGPDRERHRDRLAGLMARSLSQAGIEFRQKEFEWSELQASVVYFSAGHIDKEALLTHLMRRYPSVKQVVTVGDRLHDCLQRDRFAQAINHPVVASDSDTVKQAMAAAPRVVFCEPGQVGPALKPHLPDGRVSSWGISPRS